MICNLCKKEFTCNEEIYTIANVRVHKNYSDQWEWISKKDSVEPLGLFFHRNCWIGIAGTAYAAKEKQNV
jgi:hypothetical protein